MIVNGLLLTPPPHPSPPLPPSRPPSRPPHPSPSYRIFELPPNPQGIAALQMLNILELRNVTALGFNSADYLHLQVEAKKLAFADRAKFYADPDFEPHSPELVAWLISKDYAKERSKLIDMSKAAETVDPGTPPSEAARRLNFPTTAAGQSLDHTSADTMYVSYRLSYRVDVHREID